MKHLRDLQTYATNMCNTNEASVLASVSTTRSYLLILHCCACLPGRTVVHLSHARWG